MKNILCFGDSNTYGYNPADGSRFPEDVRWTGLLQEKAKRGGYRIIEEGLVGMTHLSFAANKSDYAPYKG